MSQPCIYVAPLPLPYRDMITYSINVTAGATYDLVITVVTREGDVDIKLLGPDGSVVDFSDETIGEDVVIARRAELAAAPGVYTLSLQAVAEDYSSYIVNVQGVTSVPKLVASEAALLAAIMEQCCSPDDDLLPDACTTLRAATSPNATAEEDLCSVPPNMCNADGHLVKLVLSGGDKGNFVCPSFPRELGNFTYLQNLDWTSNGQVGSLAAVATVLSPLLATGRLRRLYLGSNALSGPLSCSLLASQSVGGETVGLEVLWLDSNLLSGSVPSCYFTSPTLKQLSLKDNLLGGTLPPIPPGCGLVSLDLSANGPPWGASTVIKGFSGSLPNLTNAAKLTYLDVSSNNLTGPLPPVPLSIQVLKATYNHLSGPLPDMTKADDLRVLDLSNNKLTGGLTDELVSNGLLMVLRLANNSFSGALPSGTWGNFYADVDLSGNNFSGYYSGPLLSAPSLINLNLANNNLTLDMKRVADNLSPNNSLLYFNIAGNRAVGELSEGLGKMRLFNQLQLSVDAEDPMAASMPPQPLFDVSGNLIASTFPTWMLPKLAALFWASPFEYIPLTLRLQPQRPDKDLSGKTPGLTCPATNAPWPSGVYYMEELQGLYDLTCKNTFGQLLNISSYNDLSVQPRAPPLPPKPPAPPRPPPPSPPRPPRRRPPPPPGSGDPNANPVDPSAPASPSDDPGSSDKSPQAGAPSDNNPDGPMTDPGTSPGGTPAPDSSPTPAPTTSSSSGSNTGVVVGAAVGGVILAILLAVGGVWLWRRHQSRYQAYAAKRVPLTHNTVYEPPVSEGTASNYGDLQMFEFRTTDRPARHRARP